ncbi:MAG TPA: hypothetical protein VME18_05105 [Acidobacteriaceae bacterium]|nr:hypothetical protein [Acidobacteriaceae bacterium]
MVAERRRLSLRAVPVYWHLLSFDAPTLAVLWAWTLARAVHALESWSALAVLGLGTWLLYIADRLLDGRAGSLRADLRERHVFHARHRRGLLIAGALTLANLGWLIALMPAAARSEDASLFAVALLYFGAVHLGWPRTPGRFRFPRELAVAVIFACATAVPAWSASTAARVDLVWLVALFAALCWTNCAAIHVWESARTPRRWSHISTMALLVAALAGTLMTAALRHPYVFLVLGAMLASALLLFALDRDFTRARRRPSPHGELSPLALRILADAALLTPLLLLLPWHR